MWDKNRNSYTRILIRFDLACVVPVDHTLV